jgi:hypothetical protein
MMVGNLLGMLIGAEISEEDGGSPIAGALEGYVAEGVIRMLTPVVTTFMIGWTVRYLARKGLSALSRDR